MRVCALPCGQGAVGLAYWVSSVANRKRPPKMSAYAAALYSPLSAHHNLGLQMSATRNRPSRSDEPDLAALQAVLGPDSVSEEDLMDELLVRARSRDCLHAATPLVGASSWVPLAGAVWHPIRRFYATTP